ncbi:NAD(+)/NADH kinase [Ammoniphilus sp. CFH 90114]|uniref:NAD(+)/NADH kinase n=1 Tax=Ammoniphilus sp. CFH 90114 TaxID=2493665 RepID=UPI00100E69FB|nr:NAD(+)/NADH kinase [Ammoniphilus sp. CFH 90114]RXT13795.1 NAD(+)/NADH kinase [Ammoniphilus sp. CFH 90114]
MKTIGLAVNQDKSGALQLVSELIRLLEQRGVQCYVEPFVGEFIGREDLAIPLSEFHSHVDLLFVLGGDGTLLGFARELCMYDIPILGINLGNLGFLSEAEPENLSLAIDKVLTGEYYLEERMMIQTALVRKGKVIEKYQGLNDICIAKGTFSRIIECTVYIGGKYVTTFNGDGIIISTPTGSTAYSLSAGGPIVTPYLNVMLLTPIAPHSLSARPMVLSVDEEIRVVLGSTHEDMGLTIDGQISRKLNIGDEIVLRRSPFVTSLIKWNESNFFEVVRKKLMGDPS